MYQFDLESLELVGAYSGIGAAWYCCILSATYWWRPGLGRYSWITRHSGLHDAGVRWSVHYSRSTPNRSLGPISSSHPKVSWEYLYRFYANLAQPKLEGCRDKFRAVIWSYIFRLSVCEQKWIQGFQHICWLYALMYTNRQKPSIWGKTVSAYGNEVDLITEPKNTHAMDAKPAHDNEMELDKYR